MWQTLWRPGRRSGYNEIFYASIKLLPATNMHRFCKVFLHLFLQFVYPRSQVPLHRNTDMQGEPSVFSPNRKGTERQRFYQLFIQLYTQLSVCRIFPSCNLDIWSKSPTAFAFFAVLSLQVHPCKIKVSLPLMLLTWKNVPGSPHLHNFNVCIPEQGSLGMRLWNSNFHNA